MSQEQQSPAFHPYIETPMPGESRQAFAAYQFYRDLPDSERSVENAYRLSVKSRKGSGAGVPKRASGTWDEWCSKFAWVTRTRDHHILRENRRRAVLEKIRLGKLEEKTRRQEQIQDDAWELAEKLRTKAKRMLDHPLYEEKVTRETKDDKGNVIMQEITIKPSRWSFYTVAEMIGVADKLARLSVDMSTENIAVLASVKHYLSQLRQEATELGVDWRTDPILSKLFAAAGIVDERF